MTKQKNQFPILHPNAAGIDVASKEHFVAVNPASCSQALRCFSAFSDDLQQMVHWLKECQVDTVAMEATGIYSVSLLRLLQEQGLEVIMVNARHVKNVRGKKSDVSDAEWIRQLHSCGLLSASFQPDEYTATLRAYVRHRKNLVDMSATHIRMMHKALEQMNIKLQHVISDITGKSGQAIIRAIIGGERDAAVLVTLLDGRIKASHEQVKRSLEGVYRSEHVFELEQSYELYLIYQQKIAQCDNHIEALLEQKMVTQKATSQPAKPFKVHSKKHKNDFCFDVAGALGCITDIDLTAIFGVSGSTALHIISETGLDMNRWPTVKHFTSWLNLAPNNKISGGKVLSRRRSKKKNRAALAFRVAASAVKGSKHWLGSFYHRIKSRAGAAKATTATARKIAVIFYHMLKNKLEFKPMDDHVYQQRFKEKQLKRLDKQAKALGMKLQPISVT